MSSTPTGVTTVSTCKAGSWIRTGALAGDADAGSDTAVAGGGAQTDDCSTAETEVCEAGTEVPAAGVSAVSARVRTGAPDASEEDTARAPAASALMVVTSCPAGVGWVADQMIGAAMMQASPTDRNAMPCRRDARRPECAVSWFVR